MSVVPAEPEAAWRMVRLTEAVEISPKPDRTGLTDTTLVSFVPMAAVGAGNGQIDTSTTRLYVEVKKGYTHFRDGDVLFAKITPCMENGKMAIAHGLRNGVGLGSTEFHVLRPRAGVDSRYVYHFVSGAKYRNEAAHHMTGAVGQKRVPVSFLEHSEIPLPSLHEQRRIVAEIEKQFSRLDQAVASLQRVKAQLKRYKASVLKAAVEGRLVETEAQRTRRDGRGLETGTELAAQGSANAAGDRKPGAALPYETGEQLLKRILDTRRSQWKGKGKYKEPAAPDASGLPELPEGWVWASGAQLFAWSSGVNLPVKQLEGGDFPVYGGNGVNGWHTHANVIQPTLVIGRVGAGCGNVNVLDREAWVTDNAIYATWVPQECSLSYLGMVFTTANLNSVAAGSGQPFVNQTILNEVAAAVPPLVEQHRIVAEVDRRLSIVREVEAEVDANLKRAHALRQAVLARAFTGTSS